MRSTKDGSPVVDVEKERMIQIGTGEFVEVFTMEKFAFPSNMCGRMGLRSYFTRKGLILFSGPQIDPGFKGNLIVSLFNTGPRTIVLKYGEDFCTIEFTRLEENVEKPYSGSYQEQTDFPSENIEFIIGAKGVTLYEVVDVMKALRGDVKWMKWLMVAIFGGILAAIFSGLRP